MPLLRPLAQTAKSAPQPLPSRSGDAKKADSKEVLQALQAKIAELHQLVFGSQPQEAAAMTLPAAKDDMQRCLLRLARTQY